MPEDFEGGKAGSRLEPGALREYLGHYESQLRSPSGGEGAAELISRALAGLPLAADEQRRLLHHRLRCRFLAARDRLDFRRAKSGTSPFSTGLEPINRRRWRYLAKRWREWLDAAQEIL